MSSTSAAVIDATRQHASGAALRVAGLTVLERAVKQLRAAGRQPIVVVSDGSVPATSIPEGVTVRQLAEPGELDAVVRELGGAPVVAADVVRPTNGSLEGGLRVVDAGTRRAAEDAIFKALLRPDLGFVARYCNKPVSFRITRYLLCKLPITPNQVTIGAGLIGVIGCVCMAIGGYAGFALGLFLTHVQSVLDGCDGELARVRFQQSAIGGWMDTIVDDLLNLLIVFSMGFGLYRSGSGAPALFFAWSGAAMLVFANAVIYWDLARMGESDLMKLRWWFTEGTSAGEVAASTRSQPSPLAIIFALGRRDLILPVWFLTALLDAPVPLYLWFWLTALAWFGTSVGQVIVMLRQRAAARSTDGR